MANHHCLALGHNLAPVEFIARTSCILTLYHKATTLLELTPESRHSAETVYIDRCKALSRDSLH